ncbi:glycosyltransferase family 69 protein [Dothidotthia symphoricarpi CBS 119687]|uniref:Glycosyltransferase family 69 protein n=1 Tax=Dothidotthia symphoricarpi CBS 119687 TaxID=1392245 RepID=A0A6A6ASI2_9PLEO|nr:glycosyltransferase family 69 protein [Dothidotthia symphoricarpi CBS 119687]KAF2134173.1 glycosyltransferase family 69 protein [Dothidotthia symphoricarpi CBS 119687]
MHLPMFLRRYLTKQVLILAFALFSIFETTHVLHCLSGPTTEPVTRRPERVYIASIHWNNEQILRNHWNNAVVALTEALGRENVFITVYESGSWDDSKSALRELDMTLERLEIRRNITLSETNHLDEISVVNKTSGWINTPTGRELRRIPYLSRLRNWTLEPLQELARQGERFDKILFLNDVVFTTDDVFRLLNTNDGDFAAACSLDFSHPPQVYDTFALRDVEGHEMLMQTWPYFRARESRRAILANDPTPVTSCWNGMVAMPAEPFVSSPPLRFRGISDSLATSHLEGSECCLIHVDNPLRIEKQTYVNPQVRVGYNGKAYDGMHPQKVLLSSWQVFKALWENRIRRWITSPLLKEWSVRGRVGHEEDGKICLVDEMQVLRGNGWAHV